MADPYGVMRPSPIPNPTRSPGGEPVPKPGIPDSYPTYLRPIPVNTRNIAKILRGYLNDEEPALVRLLYSTWNANRESVKFQEIRNAIRDGEFSEQFMHRFREAHAKMVNEQLAPKWRDAMAASAESTAEAVETAFGTFPRFDENAGRIREWIDTRGAELVVNISRDQEQALRHILRHHTLTQPTGARELGRLIRSTVGLTEKQARAVASFRDSLLELDGEDALTRKAVEHKVQNYAAYLQRLRAERIARTELSFAFNFGAFEQMRQTQDPGGLLEGETILKQFYTVADERRCSHCGPLHKQTVELEQTFPGATRRVPNTYTPPVHPNCRCTVIYIVMGD